MILLIDNYDSFSYNLYQLAGMLCPDIKVVTNDELTPEEILQLSPSHIIISPGPGKPCDAGVCIDAVKKIKGQIPILGVCLGHQSICEAFGGKVVHASRLMHGKQSDVKIDTTSPIFAGMDEVIKVARYHSLSADKTTLPPELTVTAVSEDDGEIMAVENRDLKVFGVQFHPESVLTPEGVTVIKNFLNIK